MRYGIERLSVGKRRDRLDEWLQAELPLRFERRVLAVDNAIAEAWGKIPARSEAAGRVIGIMDALIAATAEVHGLALVTRNPSHFELLLQDVINPWTDY